MRHYTAQSSENNKSSLNIHNYAILEENSIFANAWGSMMLQASKNNKCHFAHFLVGYNQTDEQWKKLFMVHLSVYCLEDKISYV